MLAFCAFAVDAAAQGRVPAGRFEIGGGIEWLGTSTLGASAATETTPTGGSSTLFSTSTSLMSAGDIEASGTVTATEDVRQYVIGGGALWYVPLQTSPKLTPFVTGNVAYLRQLHETRTLVESGQLYRVSGGVKYLLKTRSGSSFKGYGLRAEGGFEARVKGVAFDSAAHYSPWMAASVFARFGSR
jgi:hypothetical protein